MLQCYVPHYLLSQQVPGLEPVTFTYDPQGRLSSTTQGTGGAARTSTIVYNPQGFLARQTDPLSRTVSFTYDTAGRMATQTLPIPQRSMLSKIRSPAPIAVGGGRCRRWLVLPDGPDLLFPL